MEMFWMSHVCLINAKKGNDDQMKFSCVNYQLSVNLIQHKKNFNFNGFPNFKAGLSHSVNWSKSFNSVKFQPSRSYEFESEEICKNKQWKVAVPHIKYSFTVS